MNNRAAMGSFWAIAPEKFRTSFYLDQHLDLIRELMMRMDTPVTLTLLNDVICARYLGMMSVSAMMPLRQSVPGCDFTGLT